MFAGGVSRCQRHSHEAGHAAYSHHAPGASLHHVRQDLFGEGDCAQIVQLHDRLVYFHAGIQGQGALRAATIVNEDINLKDMQMWKCRRQIELFFALQNDYKDQNN